MLAAPEPNMFREIHAGLPRRRFTCLSVSIVLHCAFLAWLLHANPVFVAPSAIVGGERGSELTRIYWEGASSEAFQQAAQEHLTFRPAKTHRREAKSQPPRFALDRDVVASREPEPGRPAGSPYGSLSAGTLTGYEVRPAIPVTTFDPVVDAGDLPGGFEGNVVIEITIDEQGNVVQASVEQGAAPLVDAKVLAAVRSWRFRPATRDGVAIASKQDVYYHFPRR